MAAITMNYFGTIEFIKKLRQAEFSQIQAETVAEILEKQNQSIYEQQKNIDLIRLNDPVTKNDLVVVRKDIDLVRKDVDFVRKDVDIVKFELQKEIAALRYDSLKFTIWTGITVIISLGGSLGGMIAHGFHWI